MQGGKFEHASVRFCPLSGCPSGVEPQTLTPNNTNVFALDASYLYWTEQQLRSSDGATLLDKVIYRVAKPLPVP